MTVNDEMKKLHNCHLIIANEIKRICNKHNIPYYIIAGTLLGAVRHNGFIPWDDDMDIGMLREDYEKFISVAKDELGEEFFLQSFETDENYALPFIKIMLNDTVLVERNTSGNSSKKGIYVDIFPFDNVPDSEAKRKIQNIKTYYLKRLFLAKQNYLIAKKGETAKAIVYKFLKFCSLFTTKKAIHSSLLKEMKRYNKTQTKKIVLFGGSYGYSKESVEREWFLKTVELPFEDTSFTAPYEYIKYLEYFYGDYKKLPPEDKRYNRHNVVELDFGKYN